jgi:hypothetical protein
LFLNFNFVSLKDATTDIVSNMFFKFILHQGITSNNLLFFTSDMISFFFSSKYFFGYIKWKKQRYTQFLKKKTATPPHAYAQRLSLFNTQKRLSLFSYSFITLYFCRWGWKKKKSKRNEMKFFIVVYDSCDKTNNSIFFIHQLL